jgi:hypothetical protein
VNEWVGGCVGEQGGELGSRGRAAQLLAYSGESAPKIHSVVCASLCCGREYVSGAGLVMAAALRRNHPSSRQRARAWVSFAGIPAELARIGG